MVDNADTPCTHGWGGLTIRQYAAIHLQQPDSGIDWLDDMIRKAKRDAIAGNIIQACISSNSTFYSCTVEAEKRNMKTSSIIARYSYEYADAMLKEGKNKK